MAGSLPAVAILHPIENRCNFQEQDKAQPSQVPTKARSGMPEKYHACWESGTTWKSALNNLRLLIQPFIFWYLIKPWLHVFPIPGLKRGFFQLMAHMNDFRASSIAYAQLDSA